MRPAVQHISLSPCGEGGSAGAIAEREPGERAWAPCVSTPSSASPAAAARHLLLRGEDGVRCGSLVELQCIQTDSGFRIIDTQRLEYRMIGPRPDSAPTLVLLHEGLGCVGLWGDFPERLQKATGCGVFVYSRAGYGQSSSVKLPRPLSYMHDEAREILPKLLDSIGFRRGLPGRPQRRRLDRGHLCRQSSGSPHRRSCPDRAAFFHRGSIRPCGDRRNGPGLRVRRPARKARALACRCRQCVYRLVRRLARSAIPQVGHQRIPCLYPRAGARRAGQR